jgi:hypothetical protein
MPTLNYIRAVRGNLHLTIGRSGGNGVSLKPSAGRGIAVLDRVAFQHEGAGWLALVRGGAAR